MLGYPCRGWRDNSKEQSVIIDVTSCEAILFRPKREVHFQVLIFSRYVLSKSNASLVLGVLWVFRSLCAVRRKDRLSSGFAFHSKLLNESLESFSSWVFCMITRKNLFALVDTVLTFELWIRIPRIIPYRPVVPSCFTGEGSQFLSLAYLSKPCCLVL
jgi:hypothetical protein